MFRSRSLRPAIVLLLAGGLLFALVGWRVLALEQTERERRAMRDSGLAVARGKADAERLAKGPRGRPEAAWRIEPIGRLGTEISAGEVAHYERLKRAAGYEGKPEEALARYEALLHPELPTWVQDIASLRSGVLLLRTPRREEAMRRLARAAASSELLVDSTKTSVHFRAQALLAQLGLARNDPSALRRFLDSTEDGRRLAAGEVIGPGRILIDLAGTLSQTPWWRDGGADVRRLDEARKRATQGLRLKASTPVYSAALVDGRIAFRGGAQVALFPLAALTEAPLPGVDRGFDLVVVPVGTIGRPGSVALDAPLERILVVPRPTPPERGLGMWIGLALGLGLLAYAIGAFAAVRGWRRSAIAADQQAHFTAAVSHEMKTPIASVRAMAELLADDPARDPARTQIYGERIDREMQRLGATVRNVLDAAHIERGTLPVHPAPQDPVAFLGRIVRTARPGLESRGFELTLVGGHLHEWGTRFETLVGPDVDNLESVYLVESESVNKWQRTARVVFPSLVVLIPIIDNRSDCVITRFRAICIVNC